MKKLILGLMLAALGANAELVDINGAKVERNTPYDIVDGESGTVGEFLDVGGFAMQTNVYDKSETEAKIDEKVSALDFYKKSEVDAKIADEGVKRQDGDTAAINSAKTYIDDKLKTYEASPNYAAVSNAAMTALQPAATNGLVTASVTNGLASAAALSAHASATDNPHGVTAAQIGALTAESDPVFAAWTNGTSVVAGEGADKPGYFSISLGPYSTASAKWSVALGCYTTATNSYSLAIGYDSVAGGEQSFAIGFNAKASALWSSAIGYLAEASVYRSSAIGFNAKASGENSSAIGYGAKASGENSSAIGYDAVASGRNSSAIGFNAKASGENSSAIGYYAYAPSNVMGLAYSPDNIYLCSLDPTTHVGSTARSLQSYLDERAKRYLFQTPATNEITCADGNLYALVADTNGVSVTLPAATAYVQDFVIRLEPADTNGTSLASIAANPADATAWQYDYPLGTNDVRGVVTEATYFTFTQVTPNRWSIGCYPATKKED